LKRHIHQLRFPAFRVAPFTGAWIETSFVLLQLFQRLVAPFTGAWIETVRAKVIARTRVRRPLHGGVD